MVRCRLSHRRPAASRRRCSCRPLAHRGPIPLNRCCCSPAAGMSRSRPGCLHGRSRRGQVPGLRSSSRLQRPRPAIQGTSNPV